MLYATKLIGQQIRDNLEGGGSRDQAAVAMQGKQAYMGTPHTWQRQVGAHSAWEKSMQSGRSYSAGLLKYPLQLGTKGARNNGPGSEPDETANYMKFYLNKIANTSIPGTLRYQYGSNKNSACPWTSVALPIPVEGLQSDYSSGWKGDEVGIPSAAIVAGMSIGMEALDQIPGAVGQMARLGRGAPEVWDNIRRGVGLDTTTLQTKGRVGQVANALLKNNATAYNTQFEQEALGVIAAGMKSVGGVGLATQYATGARAFNQSIMSYGGPDYRKFNFKYSFKPQSSKEQQEIYNIIKFFKYYSAPVKWSNDITRVYDLPGVFKIKFFYGSKENTFLNRIGVCALSTINVNYGGSKFTTYTDGTPVATDITLTFQELELVVRETEGEAEFDPQIKEGY